MNKYETIIGEYFKKQFSLAQCRYNMYFEDNKYNQIPSLMYRLDDFSNIAIYSLIKSCIVTFEGNLQWVEYTGFEGKKVHNHVIAPFQLYKMHGRMFLTKNYTTEEKYFGKKEYQRLCEMAIDDIPALYEHLKKCLPERLGEL